MISNNNFSHNNLLSKFKQEMNLRNFSQKTIKSYFYYITEILKFANKNAKTINNQDIRQYLKFLSKNKSASTLNIAYSALKLYFEKILKRKFFQSIPRAKQNKYLPTVLSTQEIKRIINVTTNPKHKLMIQLLYSSGMRVSELAKLKMSNIDLDRQMIKIKQGKGKKDRYTVLSEKLLPILKKQKNLKKGNAFLFTSRDKKGHINIMTIQKVVKQATKKAKINKNISAHTLRHSFATHLLENGVDIRYIQELLGHTNLQTTQIYTKVTNPNLKNIKSPL